MLTLTKAYLTVGRQLTFINALLNRRLHSCFAVGRLSPGHEPPFLARMGESLSFASMETNLGSLLHPLTTELRGRSKMTSAGGGGRGSERLVTNDDKGGGG